MLICSIENCDKPVEKNRNVCCMHRSRFKKYGSYELPESQPVIEICCVEGCGKPRYKRPDGSFNGLRCGMHRKRWQKYKSNELPDRTKPTEGVVKTCKIHGDLTIEEVLIKRQGEYKNSRYRKDSVFYLCQKCQSNRNKRDYKKFDRKLSFYEKDLYKNYRIRIEDYNEILNKQNNVCAICKNPETARFKNGTIKRLSVDHCHKTNNVRGLLCTRCNTGIGVFKESTENLEMAIQYLSKSKEVEG